MGGEISAVTGESYRSSEESGVQAMLLSPSAVLDPERTFVDAAALSIAVRVSELTGCKVPRCFRTGA